MGIPACLAYGQAGGTAAAIGIKQGISGREVDISTFRKSPNNRGVDLLKEVIDLPGTCRE